MLPIGPKRNKRRIGRDRDGFTLIELILVMAILTAIMAVSATSLSRFFHGRSLEEETTRFLALARFAASEAAATGVPMQLWIKRKEKEYGVYPAPGYQMQEDRPFVFLMDERFDIEVLPTTALQSGEATIDFLPDGTIDMHEIVLIRILYPNEDGEDEDYLIAKSMNGMELKTFEEDDAELDYILPKTAAF